MGNNAKTILVSHLGRPKGQIKEELKMDPVAKRLEELLDKEILKIYTCIGDAAKKAVEDMKNGEVLL